MTVHPKIREQWPDAQGETLRPKRIHITGAPRSGTTLLLSLMLSCFEIDGGVTTERRLWRTPPKDKKVVCTKFPDETDFATRMLGWDPDLHVIFILRDPRDVVVSKSHINPDRYLINLRVWKDNLAAARPWFGHRRFHVVHYADLAEYPDRVQAELASDMPFLRQRRKFSRFVECADEETWLKNMHMELRPITSERVGHWRQHRDRVKGQLVIHGGISNELLQMGFELDDAWLSQLDGVRPNVRASAAIERADLGRRVTRRWRNTLGTLVYLARRYGRLELSSSGEKNSAETLPVNENNLLLMGPEQRRSRS